MTAAVEQELAQPEEAYQYPPITLLDENTADNYTEVGAELRSNSQRLAQTLQSFGVDARPGAVVHGPSVTRYEFTLEQGVKLSKITNLADDIALALGASGVRIAPIPIKFPWWASRSLTGPSPRPHPGRGGVPHLHGA